MSLPGPQPSGAPERVLLGVPSYNEGERVIRLARLLYEQSRGMAIDILVFDESTDGVTPGLLKDLVTKTEGGVQVYFSGRRGKHGHLNDLARRFLAGPYDVMAHFDADVEPEPGCLAALVAAVRGGTDMVSALSLCRAGRNLFERGIRVMNRGEELLRERGIITKPLVGHSGAYSRRAVPYLYPIPLTGENYEQALLFKCEDHGLTTGLVRSARLRYSLVSNLGDYVNYRRRTYGGTRQLKTVYGARVSQLRQWFRPPELAKAEAEAARADPAALALIPFILLARYAADLTAFELQVGSWETLATTKR